MIPFKNKGMFLETILNITNQKYIEENVCVVTKIPTNIRLMSTNENYITKASFDENFNCDYIGIYKGSYLEFEAKETSKNYFDFQLLRKNQKRKLALVSEHNGYSFIIIYFSEYDNYFMVKFSLILDHISNNRNKIPYEWFCDNAIELFLDSSLKLDYAAKLLML